MKGVATIINEAMDVADAKRKVLTVQRLFGENVEVSGPSMSIRAPNAT